MNNYLISINPAYVRLILSGEKTVEIRRRTSRLLPGDKLWVYATLPQGQVVASVTVGGVERSPKRKIWEKYSSEISISRSKFDAYLCGCDEAFVIKLARVECLSRPISLEELRKARKFHPPQYLSALRPRDEILKVLLRGKVVRKAA